MNLYEISDIRSALDRRVQRTARVAKVSDIPSAGVTNTVELLALDL
jgi:hypothetical protein